MVHSHKSKQIESGWVHC